MNRRARRSPIPRFESNGSQQPCRVAPLAASSARPISPGSPSYRARCRRSMTSCEGRGERSRRRSVICRLASSKPNSGASAISHARVRLCLGVALNVSFSRLVRSGIGASGPLSRRAPRNRTKSDTRNSSGFGQNALRSRSEPAVASARLVVGSTLGALMNPQGCEACRDHPPAVPRPRHRRSVTPPSLARNRTAGCPAFLVRTVSAWCQEPKLAPQAPSRLCAAIASEANWNPRSVTPGRRFFYFSGIGVAGCPRAGIEVLGDFLLTPAHRPFANSQRLRERALAHQAVNRTSGKRGPRLDLTTVEQNFSHNILQSSVLTRIIVRLPKCSSKEAIAR